MYAWAKGSILVFLEVFLMEPLTNREKEVALLVAQGLSNREIADKLCISIKTVESHLTRIYEKLGIRSRTRLVKLTIQKT